MSKKYQNQSTNNIIRGFTLVELLAVIIVLSIIALIIIPLVSEVIDVSEEQGLIKSANSYIDAVEYSIKTKNINEEFNPTTCVVQNDGNVLCDGVLLKVDVSKNIPTDGIIKLKDGIMQSVSDLKIDNKLLYTDESKQFIIQ